ncbi:hypothetical protein D1B17_03645 [Companilactobacillus zhachilii]|uniref:Type II secretion system protein n=1 Tax=Companilactobacillus zhachilii TaxID=2304606 RepID=A0A386PPX3_9LACO|nr:hypothetical protein [Companilactobacillus zhachilii]AYE37774.1 hypothetical protein D1B17_03645 [Companilactobacillus zhachilii]
MKRNTRRKGYLLLESLTALTISILIIFTLNYCINEQFKLLNSWERKVNADKIVLLHLKNKDVPNNLVIKGQEYYFTQLDDYYHVKVGKNDYKFKK